MKTIPSVLSNHPTSHLTFGVIAKAMCLGLIATISSFAMSPAAAQVGAGPLALPAPPAPPQPSDGPFRGRIELAIDATDTDHQVFSVHETIPVQQPGDMVLLYPEWETGSHAPHGLGHRTCRPGSAHRRATRGVAP